MTAVSEQLYHQAQLLPESVQLEVLHYMEYLMQKNEISRQADEREQE